MSNEGALSTLDPDKALDQLASGTMLKEIAAQFGVSKQAVHKRLATHPRYRQAIKDQAAAFVHEAMDETRTVCLPETDEERAALAMVDIARVRELRSAAFRYAESADPQEWGQKGLNINIVGSQVSIGEALADDARALLDKLQSSHRTIEHNEGEVKTEPDNQ